MSRRDSVTGHVAGGRMRRRRSYYMDLHGQIRATLRKHVMGVTAAQHLWNQREEPQLQLSRRHYQTTPVMRGTSRGRVFNGLFSSSTEVRLN